MNNALNNLTVDPILAASAWQWFQPSASTGGEQVDWLFWFITWISVFFFVLIVGLMVAFLVKYRHRPGHKAEHSSHHNNALEAAWSLIPLLLVVMIFYWGFIGFMDAKNAPASAYEINVQAQKWSWTFLYPNGAVDTNLHVPAGVPVKLIMSSNDVLHSLYIPAFRVKMDCVPGKYTSLWFNATQATEDDNGDGKWGDSAEEVDDFDLFCTEYCGTGHSSMYAKVVVHETQGDFEVWLEKANDPTTQGTPVEVGERLYQRRGCAQCHSITGVDNPANGGPAFNTYFGKTVDWTNGQSGPVDENYLRESILNPMAKIRKGYRPIMPKIKVTDAEIYALIQFIKKLNDQETGDWTPYLPKEEGAEGEPEASASGEDPDTEPAEEMSEEPAAEAESDNEA